MASPGETHARRSEERTVIEENTRHSGLDPESSLFVEFFEAVPYPAREKEKKQRRFAPEVYDFGFRIKSEMTTYWFFAGHGVGIARQSESFRVFRFFSVSLCLCG
ncbi:MAG: hypothetical protein LBS70_03235 [Candidatus Accumulibacter sp.]|nr:hypothetical protein [Accumulibacter sp.]